MIGRIEKIEERVQLVPKQGPNKGQIRTKSGMVTEGQLNFIRGLERDLNMQNASEHAEMTMKEASDYINKLKEMKEQKNSEQKIPIMQFPKSVTINDEGFKYDAPLTSPLSKEEIDELGEEALL